MLNNQYIAVILQLHQRKSIPSTAKLNGRNRYRIGPVLTLGAMALLAGRRDIAEFARFATTLAPAQRRRLGLLRKTAPARFMKCPATASFFQLLTRLNPEAFARRLTDWLQSQTGSLPQALAQQENETCVD